METMDTATVALLIKYFNVASITVLAIFAFFGAAVIFKRVVLRRANASGGGKSAGKKEKGKETTPKKDYALLSAFCVAALAALFAEATLFNYQHYLILFGGPEIKTTNISPENPNLMMTTGGAPLVEILVENAGTANQACGALFKKLNQKVTSIFVELQFNNVEIIEMTVEWTDEQTTHSFKKKLMKHWPHDNYALLQPCGKVSELKIMLSVDVNGTQADDQVEVQVERITLNKQIPFYFSGLRLTVVSFLFFAIICFFKKDARERAAYYLFEYKFNPVSCKQNLILAGFAAALILYAYICVNTSYPKSYYDYPVHQQYNKYLVDALANGRTWLDFGHPENLLKAERPYDNKYRIDNGYKFNKDVMWDWAWYKGKFYITLFKNNMAYKRLLFTFIAVAVVIAAINSFIQPFNSGYIIDFSFFIILPSLFCAYQWSVTHSSGGESGTIQNRSRISAVYVLSVISVLVGLFFCVSGAINSSADCVGDSVLYRYLEYSLGVFREA